MSAPVALWHLMRPRLVPFLLLLPFFGWAWAHWDRALTMQNPGGLLWVGLAWVCLHAGTMWLNAWLDRDEGEVLMGRSVPPPAVTVPAGYAALVLCVPLAWMGGTEAALAASFCALLAVGYSHPSIAWKGRPLAGPLVNLTGYGLASSYAGWSVVGVPGNPRTWVCWGIFALGILAPYFAAQAFQGEEDAGRGYRTFVVAYGSRTTLNAARLCMAGVLGSGVILAAVGWVPRVCLVGLPLGIWVDRLLADWARQPGGGSGQWASRFAKRVLVCAGVLIGLCFTEYVRASYAHEPVAGLGTVSGHPTDRPRLPPFQLRHWELKTGMIVEP